MLGWLTTNYTYILVYKGFVGLQVTSGARHPTDVSLQHGTVMEMMTAVTCLMSRRKYAVSMI